MIGREALRDRNEYYVMGRRRGKRRPRPSKLRSRFDSAKERKSDHPSKERRKINHLRFCQAVKHADRLNDYYALVEAPFQPYWCPEHRCYHVGHNRRTTTEHASHFLHYSRIRARLASPTNSLPFRRADHYDLPVTRNFARRSDTPLPEYQPKREFRPSAMPENGQ